MLGMVSVIDVLFNSCPIQSEKLLSVTSLKKGLLPSMKHTLNAQLTIFLIAGILHFYCH